MSMTQKEVLVGEIVEVKKDSPGFYRVRITSTEGGATINAKHAPPIPSMGSALEQGQRVIGVMGSDDVFYIVATIAEGFKAGDKKRYSTMPGHGSMDEGDFFVGSADNGSGTMFGADGVIHSTAHVSPQDEGAQHLMIPGLAAINNLCRRFKVEAAAGDINCYHDDISGRTAMSMWARPFRFPGLGGKNARIHLGWHDDLPLAMFSVTVYPMGDDKAEKLASLNMAEVVQGMISEVSEYGGQKKMVKDERKDWQSRFYITTIGETVFESAPVFTPSIVPTATPTVRVMTDALTGSITTTTTGPVSMNALSEAIQLVTGFTLTAATVTVTGPITKFTATGMFSVDTAYATINSPQIALGPTGGDLRRLVKEAVYDYLDSFVADFYNNHTHIDSKGGTTTPPMAIAMPVSVAVPKVIGLTKSVKAD